MDVFSTHNVSRCHLTFHWTNPLKFRCRASQDSGVCLPNIFDILRTCLKEALMRSMEKWPRRAFISNVLYHRCGAELLRAVTIGYTSFANRFCVSFSWIVHSWSPESALDPDLAVRSIFCLSKTKLHQPNSPSSKTLPGCASTTFFTVILETGIH
eukprot:6202152-Pleurochrysis_carterae.AAC.1